MGKIITPEHLNATADFLASHTLVTAAKGGDKSGCIERAAVGLVGFWLAGAEPEIYCLEIGANDDGRKGDIIPLDKTGAPLRADDGEAIAWQRHYVIKLGKLVWDPAIDGRPMPLRAWRRRLRMPKLMYEGRMTRKFMADHPHSLQTAADALSPTAPNGDKSFVPLAQRNTYVVPVIFD